jgi:hypothetical protein
VQSVQVVGLPNNSYKPITNTAWVRARLCKLQKGCTRLATTRDKVYQLLAHGRWIRHFQQYFSYIMATSFSGGRSRSTRRDPPTMGKQLVNFISCGCESSNQIKSNQSSRFAAAVLSTHALIFIL